MPKPALSLFGCLGKEKAFEYLQQQCLLADSSTQALQQHFEDAALRIGSAIERVGYPEMLEVPALHRQYVNSIRSNPNTKALEGLDGRGAASIQLVEIVPLLSIQIHVELDRAESFYQRREIVPTVAEMLQKCLPLVNDNIPIGFSMSANSSMVISPSLNLRTFGSGLFVVNGDNYLGVKIGPANPLVQVLKIDGKAYLVNGFHRAYSLGRAGARYMPCIVQEAQSLDGIALSIPLEHLQSDNPPTLGHFLNDCAYPVQLRNYKKYMTITYGEHIVFEE